MKLFYKGSLYETYSNENSYFMRYMRSDKLDYSNIDVSDTYRDWLEDHYPDELAEYDPSEYFDGYEFNEKFPEIGNEFQNLFEKGKISIKENFGGYTKGSMSLDSKKYLPRTTWLLHFSDNARDIARNGFIYGADEMDRLALTTNFSDKTRFAHKGYNFAFTVPSRDASNAASEGKYGREAVMFMSSGVKTYHYGDEEHQVVFWGNSVKEFVYIANEDGTWIVKGNYRNDRDYYKNDDLDNVVRWIIENYQQYKNKITWTVK